MNLGTLTQQLIRHEKLLLKPYKDTVGKFTIGVGRNLDDVGISEAEAMFMLEADIASVCSDLDRVFPWWREMSENRQLVIADMCFNLGINRLQGFKKALAAMKEGRYADAATEMLDSTWAKQVGRRSDTLAEMMRSDA